MAINGLGARERSSGSFAYAGNIFTSASQLNGWQRIFNNNTDHTGTSDQVIVMRWDSDGNPADLRYQGQVKLQSGGAIVPQGGLTPSNFIHVAGDLNASGGGSNPSLYPQGPRYDDGKGSLINRGSDFSGGGFFTGYWLTTGRPQMQDPATGICYGETASLSNAVFVGGWYSMTTKFSMTSGTSGVHVCPSSETIR